MVRDFVALNEEAISAGLVKPIEHHYYRKTHDKKRFTDKDPPRFRTFHLPPDMTFGMPVRRFMKCHRHPSVVRLLGSIH
ncbi:hypothetical protein NDU88_000651 [Pleurodeles waltl]|uniref:Uncharacterized protein n=1 Tax=Pleurodeles waltl TaxID=8319 RepID=A0AAV7Q0V3_PLEWA|nr:hypothetical protein NDU88_000651 [Pleurodeles waltl]